MIGIDFNDKYVKVVELKESAQGLTLDRYHVLPVVREPDQDITTAISRTIFKAVSESGILETEVYALISGPLVQTRRITLPPMPESELRDSVKWEAQNFATFPIENALVDYYVLEKSATKESHKLDIMVVAIEKETFNKHLSALTSAGLRCVGITLHPFALGQILRRLPSVTKEELVAVVDFGAEEVSINLFKDHLPQFTREIKTDGRLQEEILSSFTYYREQFFEEKISRIFLSGEHPQLEELREGLSAGLGIATEILDPLKNLNIDPRVDMGKLQEAAPRLALAVGVAENKAAELNLVGKKERAPKTSLDKMLKSVNIPNAAIIGALVFILLLILAANFYLTRSIEQTRKELDVKNLRLSQLSKFQERRQAYENIARGREDVKNLLGQIAAMQPPGIKLVSLSYGHDKKIISLAGEAGTPQLVSGFVRRLEASATFSNVQLKEFRTVGKIPTFQIDFSVE